jgi:putative PIN family toxin of toxin-antitoxin system
LIDTGVLISAFVFGGNPQKAVAKAFRKAAVYVSPILLAEYRSVPARMERDGKIDHAQFKALITGIAAVIAKAKIIYPAKNLVICRDPSDNMLIECCEAARADFLITGDKDLLELTSIPFHLQIVSPRQYIAAK